MEARARSEARAIPAVTTRQHGSAFVQQRANHARELPFDHLLAAQRIRGGLRLVLDGGGDCREAEQSFIACTPRCYDVHEVLGRGKAFGLLAG